MNEAAEKQNRRHNRNGSGDADNRKCEPTDDGNLNAEKQGDNSSRRGSRRYPECIRIGERIFQKSLKRRPAMDNAAPTRAARTTLGRRILIIIFTFMGSTEDVRPIPIQKRRIKEYADCRLKCRVPYKRLKTAG